MKKLVLIAGIVALVVILAKHSGPSSIGEMPQFKLANIAGGEMKSDDLKGKVLIVDFWASWCGPCKTEIPKYNKLVASMAGKDFQMIGYAVESGTFDEVRKSAAELGIQYPVVVGTDMVTEQFGNYRGLPTTFLVGKDGKIYKKYEGTSGNKIENLASEVSQLLGVAYVPAAPGLKPIVKLLP